METQEHDEHIGKTNQKGNQTFIKKHLLFVYNFAFYRNKEGRSYGRRRFVQSLSSTSSCAIRGKFNLDSGRFREDHPRVRIIVKLSFGISFNV